MQFGFNEISLLLLGGRGGEGGVANYPSKYCWDDKEVVATDDGDGLLEPQCIHFFGSCCEQCIVERTSIY